MKNHLKRIASPKTWILDRKTETFIVRPNSGAHPLDQGLALGFVIRDMLGLAATMGEVRKILHHNEVLVDGKRRKDHRYQVGLFDVLSLQKKVYRMVLDTHGRIAVIEIPAAESKLKVYKVVGKSAIKKGKIQYHFHDGKNIILDVKAKVGDSILATYPPFEVKEVLSLKPGALVLLTKGKHGGALGALKEIKGLEATYTTDKKDVETTRRHLFVVGDQITIRK